MTSLKQRIDIQPMTRNWLNEMATAYHYMHRPIHQRAVPFGWGVTFDNDLHRPDGAPAGFIIFASIHYTRLTGEFGYPGLPSKWQVLSLARLWLHDDLPHNSETVVIAKAIRQVQRRWLEVHPPPVSERAVSRSQDYLLCRHSPPSRHNLPRRQLSRVWTYQKSEAPPQHQRRRHGRCRAYLLHLRFTRTALAVCF